LIIFDPIRHNKKRVRVKAIFLKGTCVEKDSVCLHSINNSSLRI